MATIIYLTLLHSLWQGLLLAIATAVVLTFTRRAAPAVRYRWLTGCLFVFAGGVFLTLLIVSGMQHRPGSSAGISLPAYHPFRGSVADYLNARAVYIVWLWCLITGIRAIRLAAGLNYIYRLKQDQVYPAGSYLQQRVNELSVKLGIPQRVRILQSALIKVPMVAGHFRPLILVPFGLISNLPPAELEAIICHELAHIRRMDFFVNILQSVLETLLFFNPAVLWINRLIREEREHCCDDIAMAAQVPVQDYVRALVSCQRFRPVRPRYALAFTGPDNQLLSRVKRLLQPGAGKPAKVMISSAILLLSVLLLTVFVRQRHTGTTIVRKVTETCLSNNMIAEEIIQEERTSRQEKKEVISGIVPGVCDKEKQKSPDNNTKDNNANSNIDEAAPPQAAAAAQQQERLVEENGKNLRRELHEDGLISDPDHFSYQLNSKELIINDVPQPEMIKKKYIDRYLPSPGSSIAYTYDHKTTP